MRLHWELRHAWYSNKRLLGGFYNPLKAHIVHQSGKLIDIGCGQSTYILDMHESEFGLIAVDAEPLQLEYLRKRIADQGHHKKGAVQPWGI